ncbi:MAG: hypothetical protein GX657_14655 [Chloroflexi bacterium]|nr:hypothetical protein [Chloroflexota bacterium]
MHATHQRARRAVWAALAALVSLAVQPLCGRLPEGHDALLHFYRIPVLSALWRQGSAFSRWAPDLMLGYGYPLFHFYPPLSAYLLTALYWAAGQRAPLAMALAFALALAAAGVGMYRLGRSLHGRAGGLLAAATYLFSPHLLYQTFERGSLSNALVMALVPWALAALLGVARRAGARRIAWAGVGVAAVLLTHAGASLLLVPSLGAMGLLGAWAAAEGWRARGRKALAMAAALALGLGVAAFFWLPALAETGLVRYGAEIASPDVHWSLHFADVLAWPPAAVDGLANPALPLTVGLLPLGLGLAGAAGALWRAVVGRQRGGRMATGDLLAAGAGLIALGAVWLATPSSAPLWERSALLRNLQFPWRCLDPAAFLLPLAAGALARLPWRGGRAARAAAACGAVGLVALLYAEALPYLTPPRHTALPERPTLGEASAYQAEYGAWGLTSWGEYLPAGVPAPPQGPAFAGADRGATLAAKARTAELPGEALGAEGDALHAALDLRLERPAALAFATYWFAGWSAEWNGVPVATRADAGGLLTVDLPAGQGRLTVHWAEAPLRAAADALSAGALLATVTLAAWPRRRPAGARVGEERCVEPSRGSGAAPLAVAMAAAGVVLLAGKAIVLDRTSTPLLRRVEGQALAGLEQPPWRVAGQALALAGYRLDAPDRLTLYWLALEDLDRDYAIAVIAKTPPGEHVAEVEHTHPGLSLTSRWKAGRLVRDAYTLDLGEVERPAALLLFAQVREAATGAPLPIADGPDAGLTEIPVGRIRLPAGEAGSAASLGPVGAEFGGLVALDGAAIPASAPQGGTLTVDLAWRSLATTEVDYTVFIHLIAAAGGQAGGAGGQAGGAGGQAGGADAQPRGGRYPTSFWRPGEVVLDRHTLAADLAPGRYRVEVGLYDLATMARLPLTGGDASLPDRVFLGEVEIRP